MKLESLKRKNKYFYMSIICGFILLIVFGFNVSRAKYKSIQSVLLARGTINYTVPDLNLVSMYIEDNGEYIASDVVPTSNYKLNSDKSYCAINGNKDNSITILYSNSQVTIGNLTQKGTKCYLYFDSYQCNGTVCDAIMTNISTIKTRNDFSSILTDTTTGVIYKSLDSTQYDDSGLTYYYAGNPTDNWVKFAGFYWRIIRINGDGTLRLIYNGTTTDTTGEGTQIGTSSFNTNYNDNMYVGFQYTSGEVHGRSVDSNIKNLLGVWFNNNIGNHNNYYKYTTSGDAGATFCNDRQSSVNKESLDNTGGLGNIETYYAAYIRLVTNQTPSFKCGNINDRFNVSVGLITADEMAYAGGIVGISNTDFYLYTNQYYWTLSPSAVSSLGFAGMFRLNNNGDLGGDDNGGVSSSNGVRPVIILKSDTPFSGGTGTSLDPYIVS